MRTGLIDLREQPFFTYGVESATSGYGPLGYERAQVLTERYSQLVKGLDDTTT